MKTPVALLLLAGLLGTAPALAGTIYRCDVDGVRSYASKRVSGARCEVVSRYTGRASAKSAPRAVRPVESAWARKAPAPAASVAVSPRIARVTIR